MRCSYPDERPVLSAELEFQPHALSEMLYPSSKCNAPVVRDGVYEITDAAAGQYLNSIEAAIYNRYCDDALILEDRPSRLGKVCAWSITHFTVF